MRHLHDLSIPRTLSKHSVLLKPVSGFRSKSLLNCNKSYPTGGKIARDWPKSRLTLSCGDYHALSMQKRCKSSPFPLHQKTVLLNRRTAEKHTVLEVTNHKKVNKQLDKIFNPVLYQSMDPCAQRNVFECS